MIQQPTVLILGAGASAPYGFPLGAGLVNTIVDITDPRRPGGIHPVLLRDEQFRNQVGDFHHRLRGSETSSIDDFLESNPAYQALGKVCIAAALTVFAPANDYTEAADRHWYRYLWERMRQGAPTPAVFRQNRVRIVTYNYERSIERYFAGVLQNTYPEVAEVGESVAVPVS